MSATSPQFMQYYGAWNNTTQYPFSPNEALTNGPVVTSLGGMYVAISTPIVGHEPSAYPAEWTLLSLGSSGQPASSFIYGVFTNSTPYAINNTASLMSVANWTLTKSTDVTYSANNIVLPAGKMYSCEFSVQASNFSATSAYAYGIFLNTTDATFSFAAISTGITTPAGPASQGYVTFMVDATTAAKTINLQVATSTSGVTAEFTQGSSGTWFRIASV